MRRRIALRVRDRWTDGKRSGHIIGGQDGRLVQLQLDDGRLLELSERYFVRRFRRIKGRTAK